MLRSLPDMEPAMRSHALLPLLVFLSIAAAVHGQPGFISIDCGLNGASNYTEQSGIVYMPDARFIDGEVNVAFPTPPSLDSLAKRYFTMRRFPNGTRNCYNVGPLAQGGMYRVRAGFLYGNYDANNQPPVFDLYLGVNKWDTVETLSDDTVLPEIIAISPSNTIQVCLVNIGRGTPFISVLEVRLLENSFYPMVNVSHSLILRENRVDYGGNRSFRYPDDPDDRIWFASANKTGWTTVSTDSDINRNASGVSSVPQAVLKTAIISENLSFEVTVGPEEKIILFMYFAELQQLGSNETREFNVLYDGKFWYGPYSPVYLTGVTLYTARPVEKTTHMYTLNSTANSTRPLIINAREVYGLKQLQFMHTDLGDVDAIYKIKDLYTVKKNWQGDPCVPQEVAWEGVVCQYNDSQNPRIVSLNLSQSGLAGGISQYIGNLTALTSLDLSNNNLTGKIPDDLVKLQNLRVLNLANNLLNGSIPGVLLKNSQDGTLSLSINGNKELCNNVNLCEAPIEKKKNLAPVIAGITGGAIFVLGVIILVWRLKGRKRAVQTAARNTGSPPDIIGPGKRQQQKFNSENNQFCFGEIVNITRNFERMIGKGGFATVYYGRLNDGTEVAVKMLSRSTEGTKDFHAEGQILTRVHHRNLVCLLGYCNDKDGLALVYEYMAKGSLADHLSEAGNAKDNSILSWVKRLKILLDVAQGLEYLHSFCKPSIVHRDVKTRNILLSENLEAKLGDFGLSRLFSSEEATYTSTVVAGTPGYLDPEYYQSYKLNEKSDVYSFGIVLLEVITGKSPTSQELHGVPLFPWVKGKLERGDISSVVDTILQGNYDTYSTWMAVELAMTCVSQTSIYRPKMSEVVLQLKGCLECASSAELSKNYSTQISDQHENFSGESACIITPSSR